MRLPSRLRALILLAIVLDLPVLARLVAAAHGEPRVEAASSTACPSRSCSPRGGGPWPAWLFVNGAHPLRRAEPVVTRLSRGPRAGGIPRARPRRPRPRRGDDHGANRSRRPLRCGRGGRARRRRGERVALIGASTGAGLALLAAARADLADRDLGRRRGRAVRRPRADGLPRDDAGLRGGRRLHRYDVTDLHRTVVARSLVATIADEDERERLLADARARRGGGARSRSTALPGLDGHWRRAQAVRRARAERRRRSASPSSTALPEPVATSSSSSPRSARRRRPRARRARRPAERRLLPARRGAGARGRATERHLTVTGTLDHTRPSSRSAGSATSAPSAASSSAGCGSRAMVTRVVLLATLAVTVLAVADVLRRDELDPATPRGTWLLFTLLFASASRARSSSRCAHPPGCRRWRSGT